MEYLVLAPIFALILFAIVGNNKIHKLQKQIEQYHQSNNQQFAGVFTCFQEMATLVQAVLEAETNHWQVTNGSMACLLGAIQYDLKLFRDNAVKEEDYELVPQIDNLIINVHKLIEAYNTWQQQS